MGAPADKAPVQELRAQRAAFDPYGTPQAELAVQQGSTADDEALRRELINTEASIQAIGTLYYLVALAFLAMGIGIAQASLQDTDSVVIGAMVGAIGVLFAFLARGLRKLAPGFRLAVTLVSVIGLVVFPLGTLVGAYILYLLHNAKGRRVMTPEYVELIARTPHIKYRTSPVVLVAFVILIALLLAVIIPALVG
jgi:hypothetical protein